MSHASPIMAVAFESMIESENEDISGLLVSPTPLTREQWQARLNAIQKEYDDIKTSDWYYEDSIVDDAFDLALARIAPDLTYEGFFGPHIFT